MVLLKTLVICALVVCVSGALLGAAPVLRGVATDANGAGLPGVTVKLTEHARIVASVVTDVDGRFTVENLAPGDYVLTATLEGFYTLTRVVRVIDGVDPQPIDVRLEVGALAETVTVTAGSPLIQTQMSARAGRGKAEPSSIMVVPSRTFSTATYDRITENGFKRAADAPLSTFSIDVDTASYSNVRRFLTARTLPPPDAVRIEELINYFHFDYPAAADRRPFSVTTELDTCPWDRRHMLALVGLQTPRIPLEKTPPRNLVFLLDVSGSMQPAERLPLVQSAMLALTETLRPQDWVAIVVYAGDSGLALPPTSGSHKRDIERAIEELRAGGSTNGAEGIQLAYDIAAAQFVPGGINRVILATDGDFNVGVTSPGDLVRLIEEKRKTGVFLSVLGVGDDNFKDATMEKLADAGNGNYAYLDRFDEARRLLVKEASATLVTVAKDVKLQIEFNPRTVAGYRLIGYEDRVLENEDFNDDRKDAGDMGAGHTVTALYEIVPAGRAADLPAADPLKYQQGAARDGVHADELMNIKLRYKEPAEDTSTAFEVPVRRGKAPATGNLGFAAAVAEFGMLLRDSPYKARASWRQAEMLATDNRGEDLDGYRAEFIRLLGVASTLERRPSATLGR